MALQFAKDNKHPNREVTPREVVYVERDKLKQQLWKLGLIRHVFQGQNYKVRLVEVKARLQR